MEYTTWHMGDHEPGSQENERSNVTRTAQGRHQGPGLIDELEAFMAPVGDGCYVPPPPDGRRIGGHQLPESPPDSGSENPYSPSEVPHGGTVPQSVLGGDYMLVSHDMLQQGGDYIYEELKSDGLGDVVHTGIIDMGLRSVRHDLTLGDIAYQGRYTLQPDLDQSIISSGLVSIEPPPVYTNLQEPTMKKRKHEQDGGDLVKCEPAALSPESLSPLQGLPNPRVAPPSVDGSEAGDEASFQCIRFGSFQQSSWHALYDQNLKLLPAPSYIVGADKGFNFSQIDEAFVCQKKNHFQVTCQVQMQGEAHYVKSTDGFKKIGSFFLHFYGVKAEDPSQEVRVEQSQSDRTKKPFHPVPVELRREGTKVTVGRLHFAETTNNNMRKKGRPNPDQRHFQLVVALRAHCQQDYMVAAQASDRIIVRASNPGQFESDCTENWWQRGVSDNSVHFNGRVGINTDRPDESCVINGNLKVMGHIVHPSDARAKHNIEELDTAQQLKNVQSIRVVKFNYDPSFAEHSGLLGFDPSRPTPCSDTGVIAQEVRRVLPEAVKEAGDLSLPDGGTIHKFLVVNKDRIFMENLGAVKELCKVTGHLESRIDQLEKTNRRLCKIGALQRRDSARSSVSNDSRYSAISNSSKSFYSDGNISIDQIRDIARNIRRHEGCHKLSHNSPKYTRKQCKSCREHGGTYTKYGKYYNYNKTNSVRYNKQDENTSDQPQSNEYAAPQYIDSLESEKGVKNPVMADDSHYSTLSKKKDSCLWLRSGDSEDYCGSANLAFCCNRRDRVFGDTELISNKFLQVVITILIFIMAVCLVVMSALYFREHQELLSMRESHLQDKLAQYPGPGYHKAAGYHTAAPHRATPGAENGHQNQIQNSKHSQHATAKKTAKEKGTHKTTAEYPTTPSIVSEPYAAPTLSTLPVTPLHASKNYVKHLHIEHPSPRQPMAERHVALTRGAEVVGGGCALDNALNAELDADCQSSCSLDPPQAYDNQEPLERNNPDKDLNETTNFARPLDPNPKEKPIIPASPERNNSAEPLKTDNESLKSQLHEEINIAESNLLYDTNKSIPNGTENETSTRLKRETNVTKNLRMKKETVKRNGVVKSKKGMDDARRYKRETNEAYLRMSSETDEMVLSEQSDEIGGMQDCDKISFGVKSKTFNNDTMFEETVCGDGFYSITYNVPVSKCLKEKHIDMSFKSTKLKQLRLCDLQCKYDSAKSCELNKEIARPIPTDEAWSCKMTLECNMDRALTLRAGFGSDKDLCSLTMDSAIPFVEYNIRIFRDCHN